MARRRTEYRAGLLALVVMASALGRPGHGADDPAAMDRLGNALMRRGLDWLAGVQKDDGAWSSPNYPALSALGLWAFARSGHPDKPAVCRRAAAFIEGFVQEDGGIYKQPGLGRRSGGLSTYNTAICMIALHAYDSKKYAPVILAARKFVADSQLEGDSPGAGGFGYGKEVPALYKVIGALTGRKERADLSNTGWAVQAMRETQDVEDLRPGGKRVDIDWQATLAYVEKLQVLDKDDPVNNGSFAYEKSGSRGGARADGEGNVALLGYGSMTYAGIESMIYARVDRDDPRVRSAVDWAARHWSVNENPGMGTRGLFYYYNIMSKALSLNGADTLAGPSGETIEWKKQIIEKLAASQRPDGSWVNKNNQFWEGDASLVTAYAVLTLQYVTGR